MKQVYVLTSLALTWCLFLSSACGQRLPAEAESALVGTWKSDTDPTTLTFYKDGTFVIIEGDGSTITGSYQAQRKNTGLRENGFMLKGSDYNIRFLSSREAFVLDYGDGMTSTAIFYRSNTPSSNSK